MHHLTKMCHHASCWMPCFHCIRYETIAESDLVILLISDSAMASNHEKVFAKLKKVTYLGIYLFSTVHKSICKNYFV